MRRVEIDGIRWHVQPEAEPLIHQLLQDAGRVIKEAPAKRITCHTLPAGTFYVKRYRHAAFPFRPVKFLFKPSQAAQEWQLAQDLEARAIPIVRHVALGERWTWSGLQESILITEGFDGRMLHEAEGVNPADVLAFLARMHQHGVLQEDLHPGNLLVKLSPLEIRLVDLHGTRLLPQLTPAQRDDNLTVLRSYLPIQVPPEIAERSARLRQQRFFERSKRCFRHNRDFVPRAMGGLRWWVRLPAWSKALEGIVSDPDGFLQTRAQILKPGRTSTVGRREGLVLKRFNLRKLENLAKDLFRPSRARRAFQRAYHLELLGIPTPRVLATAERRCCGFLLRSYLVMDEIPGATDLGTLLRRGKPPTRELARAVGELVGKLHAEGFSHRDLKETNLVLDSAGKLYVLDLDGLTFQPELTEARAALDLERLARAMALFEPVRRGHRMQFLRSYCRARGVRQVPRLPPRQQHGISTAKERE